MPRTLTFSPGDVVVVPFPFTDRQASKRRPALVCSSTAFNASSRHVVLAMITSSTHAGWPGDVMLGDLRKAGLSTASCVRWKVFTLDASLILRRAGSLGAADLEACGASMPLGFAKPASVYSQRRTRDR